MTGCRRCYERTPVSASQGGQKTLEKTREGGKKGKESSSGEGISKRLGPAGGGGKSGAPTCCATLLISSWNSVCLARSAKTEEKFWRKESQGSEKHVLEIKTSKSGVGPSRPEENDSLNEKGWKGGKKGERRSGKEI